MNRLDFKRRALIGAAGTCVVAAGFTARIAPASAQAEAAKPGMTPDEALATLKKGNAEFVTDAPFRAAEDRKRRLEIAKAQHPFAILVGCSDSRVPPELLFGRGLGELFIIRVAGNTVDQAGLGSIEFGVAEFKVPLVVVLGHERCGAVKAAVEVVEHNATFPGAIGAIVNPIIPAVLQAKGDPGDLVDNAVRANIRQVVARLRTTGPILSEAIETGRLKIVGARYDLDDGSVDFFDEA